MNGTFQTGTLACWSAGGSPLPRVSPSTHFKHRFSVQLESGKAGVLGSELRQTFTLPARLSHARLHLGFWLSRHDAPSRVPPVSAAHCAKKCPSPGKPIPPTLIVRDLYGRIVLRLSIEPHRDRAWSGLAVTLPIQARRLTLSIQVPPQPSGAGEVLLVDDVHVGP
jgi:hypothetical protein